VNWNYSGERVLTMEYCPGVKINDGEALDRMGISRELLANRSVESYLEQLLRYGFFHADPHPGNLAVDTSGRLIFYDFGMMGRINPGIRGGLLELFYAVYEKDAQKALDGLVQMGVLVPQGDLTSVKRTAQFFLDSFQTRLSSQKDEREEKGQEYDESFKEQRTKDEKKARRKEILSNIGEDLLSVSKDQPFRFPATFTFVVRAFSVLDGIGKSLSPRFDISEIARPYARELLIESQALALPPQVVSKRRDLERRAKAQARALVNVFQGPDRVEEMANVIKRIENGQFKPRVRALEVERAVDRVRLMQGITLRGIFACAALQIGTVFSVSALSTAASFAFAAAAFLGLTFGAKLLKLSSLDKKELALSGQ